ncbi:aminotransferase class I/II-fold pyridoxal phosphate-dependent enzyme [Chitinophaga oryzae]|uniref:Aminotransferase class I/II-fold pyridoxal phosphate-dependent enzyme n=1 Tax=Chitinophaga oryzae TaxID=2725414 RepID=A0AAE7D5D3_9BACT|nr:aminotransferase class I/II-fold pyridoxal phosphate-dependent enzyme [Chitinophaga oryzae]QJB30508.1 aminotransferase class I/II-fold pyridoxal phosphate-dependent enzyme [Chitinophaga oryzae]QJB37007.1 aminotransferase class I/II-fold pyridoxal phosphate-dependent enzyme [Chitinophaga oryzae]
MIQGHGDDAYLFDRPIVADFSSNVYYGGMQEKLAQHVAAHIRDAGHYPDPEGGKLQRQIEQRTELTPGMVMVTNGGTEAIYLVAQAFRGATTTVVVPTFAEYTDACKLHGHEVSYFFREKLEPDTRFITDLVFLCNPNNPTAQAMNEETLLQLVQFNSRSTFIIDEAYIEFTRNADSLLPHLHRLPNVLVLRSLTKSCCIPGLRLGYLAGQKALLDKVRAFRMPWSVNSLALEAGHYIMDHPAEFEVPVDALLADTYQLWEGVRKMPEFRVYPTHTHYFLFETLTGTAAALKLWLVNNYGILIRDASNFYGLEQGHCRIACRNREDNTLLLTALRKWTLS